MLAAHITKKVPQGSRSHTLAPRQQRRRLTSLATRSQLQFSTSSEMHRVRVRYFYADSCYWLFLYKIIYWRATHSRCTKGKRWSWRCFWAFRESPRPRQMCRREVIGKSWTREQAVIAGNLELVTLYCCQIYAKFLLWYMAETSIEIFT